MVAVAVEACVPFIVHVFIVIAVIGMTPLLLIDWLRRRHTR